MKTGPMMNGRKPKRYRIPNWSLDDSKMTRSPVVCICGTAEWKDRVVRESQRRKQSISAFVRASVDKELEKCGE